MNHKSKTYSCNTLQNTDMKKRQCPDSRPPSRKIQSKVQVFDTSVWGYKQADMCHYSHVCGSTIYISNIPGAFKYPSLCTCSAVFFFFFFLNFFLSLYNKNGIVQFSSVIQSCLTLRPHELQHARPPCPSLTPGVHSNPCPLSR